VITLNRYVLLTPREELSRQPNGSDADPERRADPGCGGGPYGDGIGDASWKKLPSGSSNVASHISAPSPGW
jgi:hypothetical protein